MDLSIYQKHLIIGPNKNLVLELSGIIGLSFTLILVINPILCSNTFFSASDRKKKAND